MSLLVFKTSVAPDRALGGFDSHSPPPVFAVRDGWEGLTMMPRPRQIAIAKAAAVLLLAALAAMTPCACGSGSGTQPQAQVQAGTGLAGDEYRQNSGNRRGFRDRCRLGGGPEFHVPGRHKTRVATPVAHVEPLVDLPDF